MRNWTRFVCRCMPVVAASVAFSGEAARGDVPADHSGTNLRQEVESLKARVEAQDREIAELRNERGDNWLSEARADEIRGLVHDVLADADTRASLLTDGVTAGHDGKFYIASPDGNFRLNIGGFVHLRYVYNSREDAGDTIDDDEFGFQIRRAKIIVDGHVVTPDLTYKIQIAGHRDSGAVDLENAILAYRINETFKVGGGRWKDLFLREEWTGATRQLAIERSLVNAIFTTHYVEGLWLDVVVNDMVKAYFSYNDGQRSGDPGGVGNDFQSDASDFALTSRVDVLLAGDWKQQADFSAWSGEPFAAFIGGAVHYEVAETGDMQMASPGVDNFILYTVDGSIETNGFNVYGAFIGRHVEVTTGSATGNLDDFGALVQAGYMLIPDKFEPFARFEWISPDDDRSFDDMKLITIGAHYYFRKHQVKLSADVVIALDELNGFAFSSPTSRTGLGLLPDAAGEDGQIVLRTQFQLVF